ncbi:MAG TPA: pyroglutamyl-peptidase I [Clostridiaceae bacterium]|nr:pyroglutamyl-peptidase I [Clostridiaceae bacterium]
MKILVTAFDPFGGEKKNPAQDAVRKLPDEISGAKIVRMEIPTVFRTSTGVLEAAMRKEGPDAVLCVGQAGGSAAVRMERVAVNLKDARIPDNEGNQPEDLPIQEGGPSAYFSLLPVKAMAEAVRKKGLPAEVSYSAGTFVCNHLMYGLLHLIGTEEVFRDVIGGFLHVPYMTEQVADKKDVPSLSLDEITSALEAALETVVLELEHRDRSRLKT